ncbi:MAG TPA: hypothetical protein EYP04_11690, partial [Anaerolineae bacterium]|nr:hypothetical protein [Anaerolineae bacterium]
MSTVGRAVSLGDAGSDTATASAAGIGVGVMCSRTTTDWGVGIPTSGQVIMTWQPAISKTNDRGSNVLD